MLQSRKKDAETIEIEIKRNQQLGLKIQTNQLKKEILINTKKEQQVQQRASKQRDQNAEIITKTKIETETTIMKTSKINYIVFVFVAFSIISCDSKREYDSFVSVQNGSWEHSNVILFNFNVNDTINKKNLFLNVRNNQNYNFSNLFLITSLNFPNGKKIVDTLEYTMADNSGHFLGKGITAIKESKLFYKENVVFPVSGEYTISITQAMRKNGEINGIESLKGITEVGFRIEKN